MATAIESPLPVALVGDGDLVPCVDGDDRPYLNLDAAASTSALPAVAERVAEFLPWLLERPPRRRLPSRGGDRRVRAGPRRRAALRRSRPRATRRRHHLPQHHRGDQPPRLPAAARAGRRGRDDRDRAPRQPAAVGAAVRAPLRRVRRRRHLQRRRRRRRARRSARARDCSPSPARRTSRDGCRRSTRSSPRPTSAACPCSSTPPSSRRTARCRRRADFVAWSGHKMYAPFGAGVLVGPAGDVRGRRPVPRRRRRRRPRRPRRGGLDRPARARRGRARPNVIGAVALDAAIDELDALRLGRRSAPTTTHSPRGCATGWRRSPGVRLLGPTSPTPTLPLATFIVDGVPHALVAARSSAEYGIGVRHGCFCAHPYLLRLLGLSPAEVAATARRCSPATAARSPARCAPAPDCRPPSPTSTAPRRAVAAIARATPPPVRLRAGHGDG